ncbi:major facilitator superfamily domain-containing protein [Protomyces lactucae-debilis]|uniref:Major facilitator superfamily domain-containing protein n=1 Tax=Protomyces lactucae-debilis TaxID=2754530 RepID=A0A1Y2FM78_PROLT|nr:major facilitator superfamily domain-containing protein [Protomyces lactucae-debilis]ORY84326.1 major facilitator superfamily domain-containing protein [Protomyces lactucae-debilis]
MPPSEQEPLLGDRGRSSKSGETKSPPDSSAATQSSKASAAHASVASPYRSPSRHSGSTTDEEEESQETPNALLILPLNFFNAFGWSLVEVPLVYLLRTRICEILFDDKPGSLPYEANKCRTEEIQMYVSGIRAGFQTIAAVLGLVTTPSYGAISDSQGRRKVLMICSVFHMIGDLCLLATVMLPGYTNPYYVLITAVFKGLGGYISAVVATQNSYVADCTTPEARSRYLGWNFATYHLGTAMGPLISGVLVAKWDRMDLVYGISVSLWALYFLYTWLILPESNPPCEVNDSASIITTGSTVERVSSLWQWFKRVLYENFVEPLAIILPSRTQSSFSSLDILGHSPEAKRHWDVLIAASLVGMTIFATGSMGLLPLYTDYKLRWGPLKASLLLSVDSGASVVSLTLFFPFVCWLFSKFLKRFGGAGGAWDDLGITIPWLTTAPEADKMRADAATRRKRNSRRQSFQSHGSHRDASITPPVESAESFSKKITIVKRDLWVARTGYVFAIVSIIGVALSTTDAQIYAAIILQSLSAIAVPAVQSIALNGVRADYNGRIMAAFAIVESLALVARGPVFAAIYNLTLDSAANSVYFTSAGVYGLCLIVLGFVQLYQPI